MARKKAVREVVAVAGPVVRHARIELPDDDYLRLKSSAERYRLSVSAYIRQAVMKQIERDEKHGLK